MKISQNTLRAGLAAGAAGALLSGSLLFAGIASADVTGYETGYSYHQGLANGSGGELMARGDSGAYSNSVALNDTSGAATSNGGATTDTTGNTVQPAASTNGVAPAANTSGAVAPAAQTQTTNAAAAANTGLSQPLTIALWVVLGIAALALIGAGIAAIANAGSTTEVEERRRVSYQ